MPTEPLPASLQTPTSAPLPSLAKKVSDLNSRATQPALQRQFGSFLPTLLMAIAILGWLSFQAFQQYEEHDQLATLEAGLAPREQAANKVRASLQALATATARLADTGNANAKQVVEQLGKRGVTINSK